MPIREISTIWQLPSGLTTSSVMYFGVGGDLTLTRQYIDAMWESVSTTLSHQVSWRVATSGKVIDEFTGQMTGMWSNTGIREGVGKVAEEPVADATQVLIAWPTNAVRRGRFVLGHTYVPALAVINLEGGNLAGAAAASIQAAANSFIGAGTQFGVWHRPVAGSGGELLPAAAGSVRSELAVQRRRRNRA